ncbi:MAG: preprotein translocase subunit SecE [Clostridia bacterium]|nr:preprotein translocase subunit SecE [Clostridia bacterium]
MKENKVVKVEDKKVQPKNKKENFFKRMGRKLKEVFSELKKVSWPSFNKIVKQTAVVLGVVLLFMIVITLMDLGLGALLQLLTNIGG